MGKFKPFIELEPKRPNRFIVELIGTDVQSWAIYEARRPVYTLEDGWQDIEIELLDPIGPSTSQAIYNGIINKGLRNREIQIKLLDPTGIEVEKWEIKGDYKVINFGELSYSSDELMKIKITFKVLSCKLCY
jgi:hypothetical protein